MSKGQFSCFRPLTGWSILTNLLSSPPGLEGLGLILDPKQKRKFFHSQFLLRNWDPREIPQWNLSSGSNSCLLFKAVPFPHFHSRTKHSVNMDLLMPGPRFTHASIQPNKNVVVLVGHHFSSNSVKIFPSLQLENSYNKCKSIRLTLDPLLKAHWFDWSQVMPPQWPISTIVTSIVV